VAEGLSVSAGRQSGEEQPFLAEASSHLEETNKAPAIGPHFAGACSPTYMRTRSRSGSRQETLPRPPRFGQKIRQEIFHDFEWRLHTEFLLRCDEASSCPKWVSRPWSMGGGGSTILNSDARFTASTNSCGIRVPPRPEMPKRSSPAIFFSLIEASSCTRRPIRYRSPAV
jgi:hypothetical protein